MNLIPMLKSWVHEFADNGQSFEITNHDVLA